ncbi:zinc ribbon domain-containing protein, partial [Nocardioides ultimimeridianus]
MRYCVHCGAPLDVGQRFCSSCGRAAEPVTPPAAQTAPAPAYAAPPPPSPTVGTAWPSGPPLPPL